MEDSDLIEILELSIAEVLNPRFFETERGYQGELNGLISQKLKGQAESNLISESEHQKKDYQHGLKIRPDIIIHEPFNEEYHESRTEGNYIIIELKLRGDEKKVLADFENIDSMIDALNYKVGIFINIDSDNNFHNSYSGNHRDKMKFYAVALSEDGKNVAIIKS